MLIVLVGYTQALKNNLYYKKYSLDQQAGCSESSGGTYLLELKIKALAIRGISNLLDRDGTDEKTNESDVYGSTQSAGEVLLQILELLISGHNR